MAGADPRSVVAVEVFVEQEVVAEMRVALLAGGPAERRPPPVLVAKEDRGQPP